MKTASRLAYLAALGIVLGGCGTDLGTCDPEAATAVVFDPTGTPFYAGQYIASKSCANGFCHASAARGNDRLGAPRELDFDVAPIIEGEDVAAATRRLRDASLNVRDHAESMFSQTEGETMPPGGRGGRFAGPYPGCTDDAALIELLGTDADLGTLPAEQRQACDAIGLTTVVFNTRKGRTQGVFRNWLACDGPLIERCEGTGTEPPFLGDEVSCDVNPVTPDFESIWRNVLNTERCTTCHSPDGLDEFFNDAGRLDFSERNFAYNGLVNPPNNRQTECNLDGQGDIVIPGESPGGGAFESLLIEKLRGTQTCGDPMPIIGTPVSTSVIQVIEEWIAAGAMNDDTPEE